MLELNKIYCMDALEGLKQLDNESVDLVVTDPPYGIQYYSGWYSKGNPHKPIKNDEAFFLPIEDLWRVLKPTGCLFSFFSYKKPLADLRMKNVIIWVKNNWTAGDLYGDFGNQYESIAFIPKEEFKFQDFRYSNVWQFDRVNPEKLTHPTQKPEDLIRRLIEVGSTTGAIILDPFIGSGTTAVAAKQLGRNFIGFEIEPKYVEIANKRLEQETLRLFE